MKLFNTVKYLIIFSFSILLSITSRSQNISTTGSLINVRSGHQSQLLTNGKVIVFGGDNDNVLNDIVYNSAELYDPIAKNWSYTGSMNKSRRYFTSALLNNGNVMAIGGEDENGNTLSSVEIYNITTNTWQSAGSMLTERSHHAAVTLNNGSVLVAGAGKKTEIYSLETNTWSYTGDMNLSHGAGLAMIVLDDGKVLATGGSNAPRQAEIYDPQTGQWKLLVYTTAGNHYYHKIVKLRNGSYLITGTQAFSTNDQISADIYWPTNGVITKASNLLTNIGIAPVVSMDDGRALVYSMGDFFTPGDTKCIQIYNPVNNTWTAQSYNFLGANNATAHKLHDGTILLIGGSQSTGNGASKTCLLVQQNSFSTCTPPNLNYSVSGNSVCSGFEATIKLPASEANVIYNVSIGNTFIETSLFGGSELSLNIPEDKLATGDNVIRIAVTKLNCPVYYLNDTAVVKVKASLLPVPVISPNQDVISICSGNSIELSAPESSGYLWSTGAITEKITVSQAGSYRVRVKDENGCFTSFSKPVQITKITEIAAGPTIEICEKGAPVALVGYPLGGTWTGTGVSSGMFDPAVSGPGVFILNYSLCGYTANKVAVVKPMAKVTNFNLQATVDSVCFNGSSQIKILNSTSGVYYQFRKGSTVLSQMMGGSSVITFNTGTLTSDTEFNVMATYTNGCGYDTLIKKYTIFLHVNPSLLVNTKIPVICRGDSASIYIVKSQKNVLYQLKAGAVNVKQSEIGNGDTLYFYSGSLAANTLFSIQASNNSCTNILLQKIEIKVSAPSAHFTIPTFNPEIGEKVELVNTSTNPKGSYYWDFGPSASIANSSEANPLPYEYTSKGRTYIKLLCTDTLSCTDSLIRDVNIIVPPLKNDCNYSLGITNYGGVDPLAVAYDQDDNNFLFLHEASDFVYNYSSNGDSLNTVFNNTPAYNNIPAFRGDHVLIKYNSKGIAQWMTYLYHDAGVRAESGDMITDSLGNVYISYMHEQHLDSVRAYSTDGSYLQFDPPTDGWGGYSIVTLKYNKYGILQWYNTFIDTYTNTKIAMAVDKELNLYCTSNNKLYKYDKNGQLLWNKPTGYADIETDSKGNLLGIRKDELVIDKYNSSGTLSYSSPLPKQYGETYITPLYMKLDKKEHIYICGSFRGTFLFNKDSLVDIFSGGSTHNDYFICKINSKDGNEWIKQFKVDDIPVSFKGMDLKNDKILIVGIGAKNSIAYNRFSNGTYRDTLIFSNDTQLFVGMTDTANGEVKMKTIVDRWIGLTSPYHLIAFAKKSDEFSFSFPFYSDSKILGSVIPVMNMSESQGNYIVIRNTIDCLFPKIPPVSKFLASDSRCIKSSIHFTDISSEAPVNWTWNFPGGTPSSSNEQNPIVVYNQPGTYTVSLTASNSYGTGNTMSSSIKIGNLPNINVTPGEVCKGETLTLIATGASSYIWENTNSTPTLTINDIFEDVDISVKGINEEGCENNLIHHISVKSLPEVSLDGLPPVCKNATPVALSGGNPAGGIYYGNGVLNGQFVPGLASIGKNILTYSYSDDNNCTGYATSDIFVNEIPDVKLPLFNPICEEGDFIELTEGTPQGGIYSGTGVTEGVFDPKISGIGLFVISYSYTDNNNCTASSNATIMVTENPSVSLTSFSPVCEDNIIQLTGGMPEGGIYYGTAVQNGMFDPNISGIGTFTINYSYTDNNGCTDVSTEELIVTKCTDIITSDLPVNLIYPNPSTGKIIVQTTRLIEEICLINSLGQKEYYYTSEINTQFKGLVFVIVKTNNKYQVEKIIIK